MRWQAKEQPEREANQAEQERNRGSEREGEVGRRRPSQKAAGLLRSPCAF